MTANPQWAIGMEVTTDALAEPTTIVKITPSGRFTTADGRRWLPNGQKIGGVGYGPGNRLRLVSPEDAEIRARARKARELAAEMDSLEMRIDRLRRSLGRSFTGFTPGQPALDRVGSFLAAVREWAERNES